MRTLLLTSAVTILAALGCSEQAVQCQNVCNKYQTCIDDDYDVDECMNDCVEDASSDDDYKRDLNECNACVEDRSCAEAVFPCAFECGSVIPDE